MNKLQYKNRLGADFEIELLTADVPSDADYFGYEIKVIAMENPQKVHIYKAMVKKTLCETEEAARIWLRSTGLDFLKSILETYSDGKTQMLLPISKGQWFIL